MTWLIKDLEEAFPAEAEQALAKEIQRAVGHLQDLDDDLRQNKTGRRSESRKDGRHGDKFCSPRVTCPDCLAKLTHQRRPR